MRPEKNEAENRAVNSRVGLTPGRNVRGEGPISRFPACAWEAFLDARAFWWQLSPKLHLGSLTHPVLGLASHVLPFIFKTPQTFLYGFPSVRGEKLRLALDATEQQQQM